MRVQQRHGDEEYAKRVPPLGEAVRRVGLCAHDLALPRSIDAHLATTLATGTRAKLPAFDNIDSLAIEFM